jgi:class 3 adenylate cyclase
MGENTSGESSLYRNSKLKPNDVKSTSDSEIINTKTYPLETIMNLFRSGITPEIISLQLDIRLEEVIKIIQNELIEQDRKKISTKLVPEATLPSSFYLDDVVDLTSAIRTAQSRVWRALKSKPEFTISFENTQLLLERFAESKITLVVMHIDIVNSTQLSMTIAVDRFATIVRSFYQEMSMLISAYGGYVLKYVGDAILAFFVVSQELFNVSCSNAVHCARSMIKVIREGVNTILNQYDYPEISVRIGIDVGENTVIQCGWDIHSRKQKDDDIGKNKNIIKINDSTFEHDGKEEVILLKRPIYDVLGYTVNITTKMTTFAKPDQIVIGQLVYQSLDKSEKSIFHQLSISTDAWSYVSNNTGGRIYDIYGSV